MLLEITLFELSKIPFTLFLLVLFSALITSVANIILLIGMLYVYLERYLKVKSKFTTTLVLFASLFLVQNILFSVYFLFNLPETIINAVTLLIFLGLEFVALALLLKITRSQINNLFNFTLFLLLSNSIFLFYSSLLLLQI